MTTKTFIERFRRAHEEILTNNFPFAAAVFDTHAKMTDRIFVKGRHSDGRKIGNYSSRPALYVNPLKAPASFPTRGKHGDTKFADGRPHKTAYFKGYKEYREAVGRQTSFVDLVMTGQLQSDFANGVRRINPHSYVAEVKNQINAEKISGQEERYGSVFKLTEGEKKNLVKVINAEIGRLLKNAV